MSVSRKSTSTACERCAYAFILIHEYRQTQFTVRRNIEAIKCGSFDCVMLGMLGEKKKRIFFSLKYKIIRCASAAVCVAINLPAAATWMRTLHLKQTTGCVCARVYVWSKQEMGHSIIIKSICARSWVNIENTFISYAAIPLNRNTKRCQSTKCTALDFRHSFSVLWKNGGIECVKLRTHNSDIYYYDSNNFLSFYRRLSHRIQRTCSKKNMENIFVIANFREQFQLFSHQQSWIRILK